MADQQKYLNKLQGDRVLIIGGSKGIGYAVAEALVEHGCNVTVTGSSQSSIEAALAKLHAAYPSAKSRVTASALALGDESTIESNIKHFFNEISKSGKLDHIVFTAGDALPLMPLQDVTFAAAKQGGLVRFFGPLLVAKYAAPHFNPGPKSSLTFTTGTSADRPPSAGWSIAAGWLAGVHGLARSLALELKPVRVNCVSSGSIDTPLWDSVLPAEAKAQVFAEMGTKRITGTIGRPEDLAQTYLGILQDWNMAGSIVQSNAGAHLM
ncbi:short chain dehydrogenase [Thozetella sp. PMI_491]|nr:short chain dehydrogenase [Thozetella sp. PMI_491]